MKNCALALAFVSLNLSASPLTYLACAGVSRSSTSGGSEEKWEQDYLLNSSNKTLQILFKGSSVEESKKLLPAVRYVEDDLYIIHDSEIGKAGANRVTINKSSLRLEGQQSFPGQRFISADCVIQKPKF